MVASPLARIIKVGLKEDLQTKGREEIGGTKERLGRKLSRKMRGANLARSEEPKVERVELVG